MRAEREPSGPTSDDTSSLALAGSCMSNVKLCGQWVSEMPLASSGGYVQALYNVRPIDGPDKAQIDATSWMTPEAIEGLIRASRRRKSTPPSRSVEGSVPSNWPFVSARGSLPSLASASQPSSFWKSGRAESRNTESPYWLWRYDGETSWRLTNREGQSENRRES